ncbi:MAG TPA: hypothetical protein VGQ46_20130 [Thermoanaerobaculia bacterium]|jgi:hypothetical protein|nr:hypothetical protein [Thermoanaerobaculia bacterium]
MAVAEQRDPLALVKFFVVTFAITWPCFGAVAMFSAGAAANFAVLRGPVLFLGIFAPSIVALSLTVRAEGRKAYSRCCGDWCKAALVRGGTSSQ